MWFRADAAYVINKTAHALHRHVERRLRPTGIGVGQLPVLVALADHGPATQREIATRLLIEQPTAAVLLKRMTKAGLIEKKPDPRDYRASLISTTPLANTVLPQAIAALTEVNDIALAGLTATEIDTLTSLLGRVRANLGDKGHVADDR